MINLKVALFKFSYSSNPEFTKFPSGGNSGATVQECDHQIGKNQILYGIEQVETISIDQLTNLLFLGTKIDKNRNGQYVFQL